MNSHEAKTLFQTKAPVVSLTALSPDYYLLTANAPEIARHSHPGQFAQLRPAKQGSIDPLLARPISIYRVTEAGDVSFIFKVVGRGTEMLAAAAPGDVITLLGPIGNGFSIPDSAKNIALVVGGVGMPPLYFLAETLHHSRPDVQISIFYGGRTKEDLQEIDRWKELGVDIILATDDGSCGHHGLITEPLQEQIDARGDARAPIQGRIDARGDARAPFDFIAACGPRPMLKAVQGIALQAGIHGQLSLEERMACGVGACLGCVCATVPGGRRVCADGPVFMLEEVLFDA